MTQLPHANHKHLNSDPHDDQLKSRRKTYKSTMTKVTISIPEALLEMADRAAEKDFTTRSDIIRIALLWYLRPQGRDLEQVNPDEILSVLKRRQLKAALNAMLKNEDIDNQG